MEQCEGELTFLPTCPASARPALIMEVSSLLQALASSSRGLFSETELACKINLVKTLQLGLTTRLSPLGAGCSRCGFLSEASYCSELLVISCDL